MSDLEKRVDINIPNNILEAGRLLTDYFKENKVTCFMGLASRDKYEELSEREKTLNEHIEFIKRWVQRVHDKETTLEEFYGVLRYYEPLKPRELGIEEGVCY
jgi:hypothetical protein